MHRVLPLFVLALISVAFAPAPFPKAKPKGGEDRLKSIQGTWKVISRTLEGKKVSHVASTLEVNERGWTCANASGTWRSSFAVTLSGKGPPWPFVAKCDKSPYDSDHGVFEIKGDTLIICSTIDDTVGLPGHVPCKPMKLLDVFKRKKP
jgi:uncharacterized protein (TIGR03067 family)